MGWCRGNSPQGARTPWPLSYKTQNPNQNPKHQNEKTRKRNDDKMLREQVYKVNEAIMKFFYQIFYYAYF
ncbi:hypothetical protein BB413_01025 [Helicobacter pylori]|uniref:Uncharacterized protein n=1 Tax=Helicobacter pylori TaxID=210 RepID=A0A2A6XH12_HELPX|nr:hypothetical protein BB413_01025 [Helicobacter pylori]